MFTKLIERRIRLLIPPHNLVDIVRHLLHVIRRVLLVSNGENSIQFFESKPLGLREQEVGVYHSEKVPSCIPGERTLWCERTDKSRPSKRDDEVEAPAGCGGHGHTQVTDVQWKRFSGVSERDGTFRGRVHSHECEDASGDGTDSSLAVLVCVGDPEGEASPQQADCHKWEANEEEVAAAEGVDCVDCWDGEEPVDNSGTEGDEEGIFSCPAGLFEDCCAVVCDDIDLVYWLVLSLQRYKGSEQLTPQNCCMNMTNAAD